MDQNENQLYEDASKLAFDPIWDWTIFHEYEGRAPSRKRKLKPTQRRDALRLGTMFCRGIAACQPAADENERNHFEYEFCVATNLLRIGALDHDIHKIVELYGDLKPNLTDGQVISFLDCFAKWAYWGKGEIQILAVQILVDEYLKLTPKDYGNQLRVYGMLRELLENEIEDSPPLTEEIRCRVALAVKALEGTKAQKTFDRHRKARKKGLDFNPNPSQA